MAIDMFLELDGIKGESHDDKHKNKIEVLGWGWGLSNTGTFHQGSGGGKGRANFKAFTLRKYIDTASCALMHHAACGKWIAKGALYIRKAGGSPLEYLVFRFSNITVTHVYPELSAERGTETIALNFSKVETEYKTQDARGLGKAAGMFEAEPKSFESLPVGERPKLPGNDEEKKSLNFLATLNAYLGQSVLEFCGKYGKKGDGLNHCAHFVSHVLSLRIAGAALCSNVAGSDYAYADRNKGFCIRVNQIFNSCSNRARLEINSPPSGKCFVVATIEDNITAESPLTIGDHRLKHIGIYMDGYVYNYSNTKDKVVKTSLTNFKSHYGSNTVLLRADMP